MSEDNRRITAPPRDQTLARLNELCDTPQWAFDAIELLRELEWQPDGISLCNICGRDERRGHAPDCRLAALLARFPK